MTKKIAFHGTKSEFISNILASEFRHASNHFFGIGTYFTDLLDYAWFYAPKLMDLNSKMLVEFHK